MKIFIRIILAILTLAVVILGIITTVFAINKRKNNTVYIFGYSTYLVTGNSMNPDLQAGDLIFIKKQDTYEVGDVITFINTTGDVVTHKIIDIKNGEYQTKGINNNFIDGGYVKNKSVYGKVVYSIKGIGKYKTALVKYEDILLAAGVISIGIIVISSIWRKHVR